MPTARIKEHKRSVLNTDLNSKAVQYVQAYDHDMNFNNTIIVDEAPNTYERLFVEAWP